MNTEANNTQPPALIICMGVSGCGKSTLAKHLAETFHFHFLEADDFHSEANKAHMAEGKPLTDAMREPWINNMCEQLHSYQQKKKSCVLAYSGLRCDHRQRFREIGYPTLFLHMAGSKELIRERMNSRDNHFMPTELLDSQFAALEAPQEELDIFSIDISQEVSVIIQQAINLTTSFFCNYSITRPTE